MYGTALVIMFLAGWNDGTTGPLLPRIQVVYGIGFAVVSLIFVFNFIGFAVAAALNVYLTDRFGFGKVLFFGALSQLVGYALEAPAPPFPLFVLGQFFMGLGIALQLSGANTFVAGLKQHVSTRLAVLHACYGAGALSSPLVATQFSQMPRWSFHYLVSLGLALINVCMIASVFKFRTLEAHLRNASIGIPPGPNDDRAGGNKYKQIMRLRDVHLLALFILIYVGTEVTLGGWIVTYVIDLRGGGPSSGYISSGFFGGLMVGRIVLLGVNKLVGERRAIFLYGILCIGLEIVVWLVPSLVGGAVAVSCVGMLLGPIYPLVMSHSRRIFPPWLLSGCIGWIAGFGQAGSAFLPFVTGALASKVGIKVLQPVVVSMMALLVGVWALVPNTPRRFD
ncbi:MFS general substrate transporter [Lentinus tigrinus ALCF2SS1-6]|uniref:MFS general substrate transporter n=1 Tax=Lentinus tigrinus ALCF2SS1-6 TaxID=1328759 RepID=A0A5C2S2N6_9APHY|nr:MFS general substrate transporter [Lentinus tigrinus ALCF2SS1-6]